MDHHTSAAKSGGSVRWPWYFRFAHAACCAVLHIVHVAFGGCFPHQQNSHVLITCWSHDCFKFRHVFFGKLANQVLQLRNVVYNNKMYFLFFSTNTIFFLNYFLGSIEGTLAYYSLEPESLFSVLWRRRRGRAKWRVLLTKGGVGSWCRLP